MEVCSRWDEEREDLKRELGSGDLGLGNIVSLIVNDQEKWDQFQEFCRKVMSRKEEDEKIRRGERDEDSDSSSQEGMGEAEDRDPSSRGNTGVRMKKLKEKMKKMKKRRKKKWKVPAHLK